LQFGFACVRTCRAGLGSSSISGLSPACACACGGGIRLASRNLQTSFSVYRLLASELFSKSAAVVSVQPRHRVQAPKSFFGQSASGVNQSFALTFPTRRADQGRAALKALRSTLTERRGASPRGPRDAFAAHLLRTLR